MDIFCLVSQYEEFGLVAAEALLCGLPVIATKVGGLQYVVENGITGLHVPVGSPQILAEKIVLLMNNPKLSQEYGKVGLQVASQKFTDEIYVDKIDSLYKQLYKRKIKH